MNAHAGFKAGVALFSSQLLQYLSRTDQQSIEAKKYLPAFIGLLGVVARARRLLLSASSAVLRGDVELL